jgi:HAD superfamily hydrolase (TIGR01509 family)
LYPLAHRHLPDSAMPLLPWADIDTVLLDMDGTLLDLHFDNRFWQEHVPLRWGEARGLSPTEALAELTPRFQVREGTLDWYCVDFWSRELELDIVALKHELAGLVQVQPHVHEFLHAVRQSGRRLVLVTNAHARVLEFKMQRTQLDEHFDAVISSHEVGLPKEAPGFWARLQDFEPYDPQATLFVDDSLSVLRAAREQGLGQVVAITRPDSRWPARELDWQPAVDSFADLMPD